MALWESWEVWCDPDLPPPDNLVDHLARLITHDVT